VDQLRDELWQQHPEIHIVDFDFYSMDVFNRCENTNDVLLAIPSWANVHPLLKVVPVEWDHSITFGLLMPPAFPRRAALSECGSSGMPGLITQRLKLIKNTSTSEVHLSIA